MTKAQSLLRVTLAYVVALGVGAAWLYLGPDTAHLWLDSLVADLLATLVVFVFSRIYRNSSFYDAYWSVVPPALAVYWWAEAGADADQGRAWLVVAVIVFWAVRLTANWVHGFPGLHHEDWRYPMLKEKAGRWEALVDLFGIHVFPTLQVFLAMIPVYLAVTGATRDLSWVDVVAVVVGLGAIALETVADLQLQSFARTRQAGEVMDRGVWAWSRHPNYLGELGFWLSMALFGLAASPGDAWWLFAGLLAMLAMFEGASIPMMEERSLERRPAYADVMARVPRLLPRPPRRAPA
jgi:steroid 5-alpha reductase family enzyme